ncbi:MAG: hypothetical protein M0Z61_11230 [Nitrospiraceae bacterium]|nr:hypothetical protein [Nitrospiraceae bacterium]
MRARAGLSMPAAATISTEESVAGIMARLDGLKDEDSGKFISYEGREIPW